MQMLLEAVGFVLVFGGMLAYAGACVWSYRVLKEEHGMGFCLSTVAGVFVFYNLVVKIGNGDAALHNYIIGLIALAVMALDAVAAKQEHGGRCALAHVLSALSGILIVAIVAMLFIGGTGKRKDKDE